MAAIHLIGQPLISPVASGWVSVPAGGAAFAGPLDDYTTDLSGAWSVARRLVSSYTGPLLRVRRSSDNTEEDIGYTEDGLLDEVALLDFIGAGNGFVRTLYNQAGSVNWVNGIAAEQPRIVNSGTVETSDGFPALRNLLTSRLEVLGSASNGLGFLHVFLSHATGAATSAGNYLLDTRAAIADGYIIDGEVGPNWTAVRKDGVDTTVDSVGIFDAAHHLTTLVGTSNCGEGGMSLLRWFGGADAYRTGYVRELVSYSTELSNANRNAVEAALMP